MGVETRIFKTKDLAEKILLSARARAEEFLAKRGRQPTLAVVLVGDDPASKIYVRKKSETCKTYSLNALDFFLSPSEGYDRLEALVHELNARQDIDGILVQSPLPKGWNEARIQGTVLPSKDVDGFHPENVGRLSLDTKKFLEHGLPSCTPAGVIEILREGGVALAGKHAVVIGRSNIVGKPMAQMLLAADATVTICHSKTPDLIDTSRRADVLVAALGKARFVTHEFVKPGAAVIDVGINRENGRLVGDVDAESVIGVASFLTPVPSGVGPMTIAILIRNTVRAAFNL
jgi:methylenetetrahydrofolate dehydrogenase (NADP+)/methenyltetrahydrofolate cyclohydrolase